MSWFEVVRLMCRNITSFMVSFAYCRFEVISYTHLILLLRLLQLLLCFCAAINFHLRSNAEYAQTAVQKALAWEISCKHGRGTTYRYFAFRTRWNPRGFFGYFIIVYYCNYIFIIIISLYCDMLLFCFLITIYYFIILLVLT